MEAQFIIGRAGSGKTYRCLESIRTGLAAEPVHGPRLILLVPEQASFQTEHALIVGYHAAPPPEVPDAALRFVKGVGVMHRADVLPFERLGYRILDHAGITTCKVLSTAARAMVLRHLIAKLAGQLVYYQRVERFSGFLNRLGETIQELIQESITPEQLIDAAATGAPARVQKLADISLIYRAYLEYLGDDRLDPSQMLDLARRYLSKCEWLDGARIWVDGFAGFTRLERKLLVELAERAEQTQITLLGDPDEIELRRPPQPWDLFGKTSRSYQQLFQDFRERGIEVAPPILLRSPHAPRFRRSASLERLERTLFALGREDAPATHADEGVQIVELPTRRLEADYAVARIRDAVRQSGGKLRYRDIGIIVRDLTPYDDLLTAALTDRGVPFFVDRRRSVAHHPLIESLRSLCRLAAEDLSLEAVRLALKTGLFELSLDECDELENYLLAHGIAGQHSWNTEWTFQSRKHERPANAGERVNRLRRRFFESITDWLRTAGTGALSERETGHTAPILRGREWAVALRAAMSRLRIAEQIETWAERAEETGELDEAAEHHQVWRDVDGFLNELDAALSDTPLSIGELSAVIDAGLSQLTLGLTPPMLDQVLVGAIERSRHPELRLVVLLGFNDGVFPRPAVEDTMLNDDDRQALISAGAEVTPPHRQRAVEEALLAYIACTRAAERLIITYSAADEAGKALRPSPFLDAIRSAGGCSAVTRCGDPIRQRALWSLHSTNDLACALAAEFRQRSDAPPVADRRLWNALYERVRLDSEFTGKLRCALSALDVQRPAALAGESIARLFPGTFTTSISRLEAFAACPFQHFAQYELKLEERELAELEPVDVGRVHHAILEDFVGQLVERGRPLHDLDDGEVMAELEASCARVGQQLPRSGVLSQAREQYLLMRSSGEIRRVVLAQRHLSRGAPFRPRKLELKFGFEDGSGLPALEIHTAGGRRVQLRGVIDRVDLAELADELLGIVIDYKRTRDKRLSLTHVYHGLSLQLVAYLLALTERGTSLAGRPIRPVGAFYISLHPQYQTVEHPDDFDPQRALNAGPHRPRGVLDAAAINALDGAYAEGQSAAYQFARKQDGSISRIDTSDGAEREAFEALLAGTRAKLGELADRVLEGDISVAPYRLRNSSPCTWCAFGPVCRFEYGQEGMRFLDNLKRSEVFARLTVRGKNA